MTILPVVFAVGQLESGAAQLWASFAPGHLQLKENGRSLPGIEPSLDVRKVS